MVVHTDLAALKEKYQKIMAKFTCQGKESEAKERLRHLFHNQMTFVSSLAPEPEDWNAWTEECIQKGDWPGLCRVINQLSKSAMMPVIYGGYNYEKNVHCVLECFACGNIQAMERILPPQLAQVQNCNDPFFPAAAHLLIGLWYRDAAVLEQAVPNGERFLGRGQSTLLEKGIVSFLLDLVNGDMDQGSKDLLAVCKGYPKDKNTCWARGPSAPLPTGFTAWPSSSWRRTPFSASSCRSAKTSSPNSPCGGGSIPTRTAPSGPIIRRRWPCWTASTRRRRPSWSSSRPHRRTKSRSGSPTASSGWTIMWTSFGIWGLARDDLALTVPTGRKPPGPPSWRRSSGG